MPLSMRDGDNSPVFSIHDIRETISDMDMGAWISSLLKEFLTKTEFSDSDFVGPRGDMVPISDLIQSMAYYATELGYSPMLESSEELSPTFAEFERRPGVYRRLLKKVDMFSTQGGGKKMLAVKKTIRVRVGARRTEMCGKPKTLGVFGGNENDMKLLFEDTDNDKIVEKLHSLGKYPQEDPRFYIHMVYRYYMNDLHSKLAGDDKVLRYLSILKTMNVKMQVNCVLSTLPELRMFLRESMGYDVSPPSLPVPSKTEANEVSYACNFEAEIPWVPAMRAKIYNMWVDFKSPGSQAFREVYPK